MNWSRGFFRLWVLITALYAAVGLLVTGVALFNQWPTISRIENARTYSSLHLDRISAVAVQPLLHAHSQETQRSAHILLHRDRATQLDDRSQVANLSERFLIHELRQRYQIPDEADNETVAGVLYRRGHAGVTRDEFDRNYAEYLRNLLYPSDQDLNQAGLRVARWVFWRDVRSGALTFAAVIAGPPLLLLVGGASLGWAISGFRGER